MGGQRGVWAEGPAQASPPGGQAPHPELTGQGRGGSGGRPGVEGGRHGQFRGGLALPVPSEPGPLRAQDTQSRSLSPAGGESAAPALEALGTELRAQGRDSHQQRRQFRSCRASRTTLFSCWQENRHLPAG